MRFLKDKKKELEKVYDTVLSEELNDKVTQIEETNRYNKHHVSWKLINKITGRKATKRGILKGKSKEDRVNNWYNYFKELLGKQPKITNEMSQLFPF